MAARNYAGFRTAVKNVREFHWFQTCQVAKAAR